MRSPTALALTCLCLAACAEGAYDDSPYEVARLDVPLEPDHEHEHTAHAGPEGLHPDFLEAENPVLELDAIEAPVQAENLALRALLSSIQTDGDVATLAFERFLDPEFSVLRTATGAGDEVEGQLRLEEVFVYRPGPEVEQTEARQARRSSARTMSARLAAGSPGDDDDRDADPGDDDPGDDEAGDEDEERPGLRLAAGGARDDDADDGDEPRRPRRLGARPADEGDGADQAGGAPDLAAEEDVSPVAALHLPEDMPAISFPRFECEARRVDSAREAWAMAHHHVWRTPTRTAGSAAG